MMRLFSFVAVLFALLGLAGCAEQARVHNDDCVTTCLAAGKEQSLEHLHYVLELNREALKVERDDKTLDTLREIIAGIEAHIAYIEAGLAK